MPCHCHACRRAGGECDGLHPVRKRDRQDSRWEGADGQQGRCGGHRGAGSAEAAWAGPGAEPISGGRPKGYLQHLLQARECCACASTVLGQGQAHVLLAPAGVRVPGVLRDVPLHSCPCFTKP